MKHFLKKLLTGVLALTMLATCAAGLVSCGETNYAANNTTFKIGVSGPLTGGAAVYGIAVRNSALLAIEEINAIEAKSGANGWVFELIATDDMHDPTKVSTNYATMYEAGMQVSLGCVTSKPALEFTALSAEDNVFFLTPSASADSVPANPNGYQMCFADSNQGAASAEYFNENYAGKTIGVLYKSDDEYSLGIYNKFKANLDASLKAGLKEAPFTGEPTSFDAQIDALKECDVIFMPIYYGPASQFMVQAKGKVADYATYYGCDGLDGIDSIDGFDITSIPQEISFLSHFNSTATSGPAYDYLQKYSERFDTSKEPTNQFGAAAYDCVYAIYEAMKVAKANGEDINVTMSPSALCDILKEIFNGDFVFHGVTGECNGDNKSDISWSDDGTVNKVAVKYVVKEADAYSTSQD